MRQTDMQTDGQQVRLNARSHRRNNTEMN